MQYFFGVSSFRLRRRSITAAVIVTGLFAIAGCVPQTSDSVADDDDATLKELVIQHLTDTSGHAHVPPGTSHFVIETVDRRTRTVSVTGIFRSGGEDDARVGRFWVELQRAEPSWEPKTIAITSMWDSRVEGIRWP
ncbi:MAG: hypothetical protein ACC628_20865 [Pirellulaceae bacterium]